MSNKLSLIVKNAVEEPLDLKNWYYIKSLIRFSQNGKASI